MKSFEGYHLKNLKLRNRFVFPPMDTYQADQEGRVNHKHFVHYVSRATGGVGLIIMEATAIRPQGRISDHCLGLWEDQQIDGLARLVKAAKEEGAHMAIQLNHAGRKCGAQASDPDYIMGPSPIAFDDASRTPREMTQADIKQVIEDFKAAAKRADAAGFDALEVHGAHGYLISEFLSPLSNKRRDDYGGNLKNRTRFLEEVLTAIHQVWPKDKALILRLSASDHLPEGMQVEDMVQVVKQVKDKVDLFHISSGGVTLAPIDLYPGYQVKLAQTIKDACQVPVIAVGLITSLEMTEEILGNERADLLALGRLLFREPHWVLNQAFKNGVDYPYPEALKAAFLDKLR